MKLNATVVLIVLAYVFILVISIRNRMNKGKTEIPKKTPKEETRYEIPKIIYAFWDSPVNDLPFLVKACMDSWKKWAPDYEIRIMNYENTKHIPIRHKTSHSIRDSHARYSEFVRAWCIAETGGVWMDASILLNKPLDSFLEQGSFNGYYLNDWTENKNWPVIESWFFAAPKGDAFARDWKEEYFRANEFENMGEYVDDLLVDKNVDTQGIHHSFIHYLAMHVAAQYCIQKKGPYKNMNLIRAEDDALMYLAKNDWNVQESVEDLCKTVNTNTNIIKFRNLERKYLTEDCISKLSSSH